MDSMMGPFDHVDKNTLLFSVEASCTYPTTSTMKEAESFVELGYADAASFAKAVNAALTDPRLKRLSVRLSIPAVLNALCTLYDVCALDSVDNVIIHYGGSHAVRFSNTSRTPDAVSCSLLLPISEVRMRAAVAMSQAKVNPVDTTIPLLVFGVIAVVGIVLALRK